VPLRLGAHCAAAYARDVTREDYRHLPEAIRLEDTIAEVDMRPVPDPDGGINPETIFAVRYGLA
jgi:hypothetical protein